MPDDYFDMLPKHYYAKVEGYNNRKRHEAEMMRQQAFIIASPYLKEGTNYERFKSVWPMWFDERKEAMKLTSEQIAAILKRHNDLFKKRKK